MVSDFFKYEIYFFFLETVYILFTFIMIFE